MTKSVTIDAPLERVLEVEHDFASQSQWWPGLLKAEVLETDDQGRPASGRAEAEVAKVGRYSLVLHFDQREDGVSWRLDKFTAMQKTQNGDWTFTDRGDSTEATLTLEIDTTVPLPGFLQKKLLDGQVKGVLAGLKKACES
ncbi:SRPBCC family protein [Calidifontibacter indicus]|uniref:SRPBCC family protein n=1 Tax=Calidifontibacter indicus TaxID=419650 RepID=UPI003D748653